MAADILCLGEAMVEFNQQPDGSYIHGFGGDTSNCAIAAARQGARVGYVTQVGADPFGRSLIDLWQKEKIDIETVREIEGAQTGIYFVTHGKEGHEFSYFRANSAASQMKPTDIPIKALQQAKILHVSGISQAISSCATDAIFAAIEIVQAAGGLVSYDSNLRLKLWPLERARAVIHAGMAQCDIALPGMDDAMLLTGLEKPDDIVDFYLGLGAGVVALTLGKGGALVSNDSERVLVEGKLVDAIDATGAGDTFDGSFLARIAAGDTPFEAARYANAAAALSTMGYGAVSPMPHKEQVEAFLQQI